jgi:hypothetical protein
MLKQAFKISMPRSKKMPFKPLKFISVFLKHNFAVKNRLSKKTDGLIVSNGNVTIPAPLMQDRKSRKETFGIY